jgi:hypothetical protein
MKTFDCQRSKSGKVQDYECSQIILQTVDAEDLGICLMCEHGMALVDSCPFSMSSQRRDKLHSIAQLKNLCIYAGAHN